MANRIRGNVIIVDSAASTVAITTPGDKSNIEIIGIAFWSLNSTGLLEIADATSSSDIVVKLSNPVNGPATVWSNFSGMWSGKEMRINTLTVGTAWIYLG